MDIVALYITGKILHLRLTTLRLALGGTIGGVYGVLSLFIGGGRVWGTVISAIVCAVICLVTFGARTVFSAFLAMFCFFVSGAAISGIMTAVITALGNVTTPVGETDSALSGTVFILVSGVSVVLTFLFGRVFSVSGRSRTAELTVTVGEKQMTVIGISDSGNTAVEPISGSPVIVVRGDDMRDIIPTDLREAMLSGRLSLEGLSMGTLKRTRIVPITTVTGRGVLLSYRPDKIEVKIKGKKKEVDGVIAIDSTSEREYDGAAAILPSSILV
ncbi:MAG: sigma-E processing peptidase SpoIIGA [Clostridia bacterium]|nr:sigma-E processing peptidase SpoIIGA [Clostridia bacterium]